MKFLLAYLLLFLSTANFAQDRIVADLKVEGNQKLKTSLIKKISKVRSGVLLDSVMIKEDIQLLKRLPAVTHAYYEVINAGENKYHVFYYIEENLTLIPQLNVYTSNDDEFAYRVGLYEFNLLGLNIAFGGFYQNDIYSSFGINLRAPNLISRKFGLALNFQNLTTQEPVFFNNTTADYRYNNRSFEGLGLYQLNLKNRLEIGINYFTENYEYKDGATDPSVPLLLKVDKLMYKLIYEFNDLDYNYQYLDGFKSTFNFQYVTARGEALPNFLIGWNDFQYFRRMGARGNWANRLRLGIATNNNTPFAPFSVDNNLNIRGVGNTIDRGTGAIVLNTEYRHTLFEKGWFALQGNAFVDAGSWRNPGGDFGDFGKADNIRIHPGLGIRFIHKTIFNAIFRIDYGFGITENDARGLVFGIGQYF